MSRLVVIGNSGGGKSTLARRLGASRRVPVVEIDALLWRPGWTLTPPEMYDGEHMQLIAGDAWLIEGLGTRESIPARLQRATEIVLIDMPVWVHYLLAAQRHAAWSAGTLVHPPAGNAAPPPLEALFRTIFEVDRDWMPDIRRLAAERESAGVKVHRVVEIRQLDALQ